MKQGKQLERRTFNQDRFDILIKRQRNGKASFNELTELDEIVNRDPGIRESILEEMQEMNNPTNKPEDEDIPLPEPIRQQNLLSKIRSFFNLFTGTDYSLSSSFQTV